MASKAPKTPGNRRTTYQAAGTRSSGSGTVITTHGGGSTATINPGKSRGPGPRLPGAKPAATPAAKPVPAARRYRLNPARPAGRRRREVTPRQLAAGTGRGVRKVTERGGGIGPKHTLTVELLIGLGIVLVRVVADYEPQASGTIKGKVGHPQGQYGPLPVAAGLIAVFFILSFFVAKGGRLATVANAFGALVVLGLGINSVDEFNTVAATFPNWGAGKTPKGSWESSGTAAGSPIGDGSGGGGVKSTNPKFQPPSGSIPVPKGGCPQGYLEEGDEHGHTWCAPITEG